MVLSISPSTYQEQLPVSGAPVTSHKFEENKRRFQEYIYKRTLHNYKFYLFGVIVRQLFDTYNMSVSTGSYEEFCHTILAWLDQNCSLPQLRRSESSPIVSECLCVID
jgi:MAX-like protein X